VAHRTGSSQVGASPSDLVQYFKLIGRQPGRVEPDVNEATEENIDSAEPGGMKLLQHRTPPHGLSGRMTVRA
jgi:hypothetical protein